MERSEIKPFIAKRVAKELHDGDVVNLGIGLARAGKKVLLVEADAQGSMAVSLGIQEPDELDVTLVNIMEKIINDEDVEPGEGIRHVDNLSLFATRNGVDATDENSIESFMQKLY